MKLTYTPMNIYLVHLTYHGVRHTFNVLADSEQDAIAQVRATCNKHGMRNITITNAEISE